MNCYRYGLAGEKYERKKIVDVGIVAGNGYPDMFKIIKNII
jgi:hypothetical protein